jgi:GNAT superfamily N-acetyltransferase
MIYRKINISEIKFLKVMLYEALFVPDGEPQFPKSIVDNPNISKYIDHWGEFPNDYAIVAENNKKLVGAIWGRIFKLPKVGYGFINEETPEISMAVVKEYRNRGIGTKLIEKISQYYLKQNMKAISLSVDKRSKAKELYLRNGFEIISDAGTAFTMKKEL